MRSILRTMKPPDSYRDVAPDSYRVFNVLFPARLIFIFSYCGQAGLLGIFENNALNVALINNIDYTLADVLRKLCGSINYGKDLFI